MAKNCNRASRGKWLTVSSLFARVNEHRCGMQRRTQVLLACAKKSPCRAFSSSGGGRNLFQFKKTIFRGFENNSVDPFRRFERQAALLIPPVFRQIMADVLGETLSFTDSTEASALGAVFARLARLRAVTKFTKRLAQQVLIHETVTPRADQLLVYQELYPVFFKKPNKF